MARLVEVSFCAYCTEWAVPTGHGAFVQAWYTFPGQSQEQLMRLFVVLSTPSPCLSVPAQLLKFGYSNSSSRAAKLSG
eukprot:1138780-Pelagomonas_calceolata.AAC.2